MPSDLCSSFKMQQPGWSSAYPSSPMLHHASDSRLCYLTTVLQITQAHPIAKAWSNHTPQPVHYALPLPISWLHNGGTSSTLTSGQQKHRCRLKTHWLRKKSLSLSLIASKCSTWSSLVYWRSWCTCMILSVFGIHMVECTYCKSLWIKEPSK